MDIPPPAETGRLAVSSPVLRAHAAGWDQLSHTLSRQATTIAGLSLTGRRAGPFADFLAGYEGLVSELRDRCAEGAGRWVDIADTLIAVANEFDSHDVEHGQQLARLDEDL